MARIQRLYLRATRKPSAPLFPLASAAHHTVAEWLRPSDASAYPKNRPLNLFQGASPASEALKRMGFMRQATAHSPRLPQLRAPATTSPLAHSPHLPRAFRRPLSLQGLLVRTRHIAAVQRHAPAIRTPWSESPDGLGRRLRRRAHDLQGRSASQKRACPTVAANSWPHLVLLS